MPATAYTGPSSFSVTVDVDWYTVDRTGGNPLLGWVFNFPRAYLGLNDTSVNAQYKRTSDAIYDVLSGAANVSFVTRQATASDDFAGAVLSTADLIQLPIGLSPYFHPVWAIFPKWGADPNQNWTYALSTDFVGGVTYMGFNSLYNAFWTPISYGGWLPPDTDVNVDRVTDISDLALVGLAGTWDTYGSHPHWIRADTNRDGQVDIGDLGTIGVAANWNHSWTEAAQPVAPAMTCPTYVTSCYTPAMPGYEYDSPAWLQIGGPNSERIGEITWAVRTTAWNAAEDVPPTDCSSAIQQALNDPKKTGWIPVQCWRFVEVQTAVYDEYGWEISGPPIAFPELGLNAATNINDAYQGRPAHQNDSAIDGANYSQRTMQNHFGDEGALDVFTYLGADNLKHGRLDEDLIADLRANPPRVTLDKVPVNYIRRDGHVLFYDTRTASALDRAGIPRNQWYARDVTGINMFEDALSRRLKSNGLTSAGIPLSEIRIQP